MKRLARLLTWCVALCCVIGTTGATDLSAPSLRERERAQVQAALERLAPQRPGVTDLYAVGFGGDNTEDVFRNETRYFETLMTQRFGAKDRVVTLINHADSLTVAPRPLATLENLRAVLKGVAAKMDTTQDVLLLFMTMHGTRDHFLYVRMAPAYEDLIDPQELRRALDDAGIRNRVLVISACFSGGFIPELRNDDTLIVTAARRDRPSFGCGSDSAATFFGRAYLVNALNDTTDFVAAFDAAKQQIAGWEKVDGFKPSKPQIEIGTNIAPKLQAWRAQLAAGPQVAFPYVVVAQSPDAGNEKVRKSAAPR